MLQNKKLLIILLALILIITTFSGCTNPDETQEGNSIKKPSVSDPSSRTIFALGTVININLYDLASEEVFDKITNRISEIESRMTISGADSEVIEINKKAGQDFVKVSDDTYYVIEKGKYFSQLSGGRFDITIGPIVKLWNIGTEEARVPAQEEIDEKIKLVNYQDIALDEENKSVKLNKENMILDLGGIAKGYAADEVARILKENNIERGIINLGGNVYAYGSKADGSPWRIGIQNPFSERGDYIGIIQVVDKTIVSSGVYERYLEENGKKYHHILDPETGYPVENGLVSISIITDSSINADSLSTSVFAMGLDKGKALVESLDGVEAIFITENSEVYTTSGLKDSFKITDGSFKLMK